MKEPSRVDRNGSLIIDLITNVLIITVLFMSSQSAFIRFIALLIPVFYYPCLHTLFSRSIGDTVFNLKVIDQQGNNIGFRLAMKRVFCVLKYSIFILMLINLLFFIFYSHAEKDIREVSFNFEEESNTYLVKAS